MVWRKISILFRSFSHSKSIYYQVWLPGLHMLRDQRDQPPRRPIRTTSSLPRSKRRILRAVPSPPTRRVRPGMSPAERPAAGRNSSTTSSMDPRWRRSRSTQRFEWKIHQHAFQIVLKFYDNFQYYIMHSPSDVWEKATSKSAGYLKLFVSHTILGCFGSAEVKVPLNI